MAARPGTGGYDVATIEVHASGPVFDGRAARAAHDMSDAILDDVSSHAKNLIDAELSRVLRNPTGYYQSRIRNERVSANTARVHDSGVVYGPWLEGVGSRNSPVTRFPGYGHWRRTKQRAADEAGSIAERTAARYLPRMR